MKRIELEIVADNSQYIRSAKEVEQATTSMHSKVQQGQKREKGLIEDTIDAIKEYEEKRKKAYRIEDVERYNKKIAEARQTLKSYNEAGLKQEEATKKQVTSSGNLLNIFKKMIGPLLTLTAATKAFKLIMDSTQKTGDFFRREITGIKFALDELWRSIALGKDGLTDLGKKMTTAFESGKEYAIALDNIGDRERELRIIESEREIKLAELAKIYRNTGLVGVEGYKKRQEAAEEFIRLSEEGERDAIELLKIRLEAELSVARQALGFAEDYKKANEEEREQINNNIIASLRKQKIFEANEMQMNRYASLLSELASAEQGVIETRQVGDEMILVRGAKDINHIEALNKAIAETSPEIKTLYEEYTRWSNVVDGTRTKITNALVDINKKQKDLVTSTIRANTMAELAGNMVAEEEEKNNKERLDKQAEFYKALSELQEDYEKSQIDKLEGTDKINAEKDYQLKQILLLRIHLENLGTLTDQHYMMIAALEEAVRDEALKKELDYQQEILDKKNEQNNKILNLNRQLQEEALELLDDNEEEKLRLQIKFAEEDIKLLEANADEYTVAQVAILKQRIEIWNREIEKNKGKAISIWSLFGIDPDSEEADALRESLNTVIDNVSGALDDLYSLRVEDATRTRELLDDQINMTQDALEAEMELMKAGLANNVDAKRKELALLKAEREKALRDEEKAIKAQRQLDTAMQLSSLISASADIFKSTAKIPPPLGQILAIAAIGTMFAAFASAKVKAAAATKLAEGGVGTETGMITGHSHAEGGEPFLKHVEVERGEMFGVLNRHASRKYGKAFTEIVNNFNRDNLVIDRSDMINNVVVDVNQTNDRLDKVEYQLIRLNRHFSNRAEIQDAGNVRIEKRGNRTRIIRK